MNCKLFQVFLVLLSIYSCKTSPSSTGSIVSDANKSESERPNAPHFSTKEYYRLSREASPTSTSTFKDNQLWAGVCIDPETDKITSKPLLGIRVEDEKVWFHMGYFSLDSNSMSKLYENIDSNIKFANYLEYLQSSSSMDPGETDSDELDLKPRNHILWRTYGRETKDFSSRKYTFDLRKNTDKESNREILIVEQSGGPAAPKPLIGRAVKQCVFYWKIPLTK